jgi:dihydroorotate dehydrogenase
MYRFFRSYLFTLDPERAHQLTLGLLRLAGAVAPARWMLQLLYAGPAKPVKVFGLNFRNPIGLAAGYDKDAIAVRGLAALGFGHIEIGTVTPLPQPGNPKPRLFRLIEDEALVNRLGFPSRGSAYVQRRMNRSPRRDWLLEMVGVRHPMAPRTGKQGRRSAAGCVIGVNIGRNKDTPNEGAAFDYLELLQNFAPHADYLTINVSSPNTPDLRELQKRGPLEELLGELHAQRQFEQREIKRRLRLLVKLDPDLSQAELAEAVDVSLRTHMDGIIVTNTTLSREGLRSPLSREEGGLSGPPLRARSEAALQGVLEQVSGEVPVVSAGGISGPDDVKRRMDMGAALVQVYTALVYRGPGLVKSLLRAL